jgi:hypothetical protein
MSAGIAAAQNGNGNGNGNGTGNMPENPGQQFEAGAPSVIPHRVNQLGDAPTKGGTAALSPITNHGGPRMGSPKPYLIWYGNWNQSNGSDTPAGQQLVRDFLFGLSNSPYYQINTTYSGPTGTILSTSEITVGGSGRLTDRGVTTIVSNAITGGQLAKDPIGVYFVITSSDISKSGFCTQYCGWHTRSTIGGVDIKYSFVGNANRCLNACAAQTVGPNGNAGVDGMISVIAHELEETNTDPDLNAWYDSSGAENADKCAWTFGQGQTLLSSGAYYNMTLPAAGGGNRNYLVQRNLSAADNKCYINFTTKAQ